MSQAPSAPTSSTNFETIFTAALEAYKQQTKKDIASHPLAVQLQSCDSPSAIIAVLQAQVQAFDQSQSTDEALTKWLDPTVNVLYAFSATIGSGVGLVNCETQATRDLPSDMCDYRYSHLRIQFLLGLVSSSKWAYSFFTRNASLRDKYNT